MRFKDEMEGVAEEVAWWEGTIDADSYASPSPSERLELAVSLTRILLHFTRATLRPL